MSIKLRKILNENREDLGNLPKIINHMILKYLDFKKLSEDEEEEYFSIISDVLSFIYENKLTSDQTIPILLELDSENNIDNVILIMARDFVCKKTEAKYIFDLIKNKSDLLELLRLAFFQRNGISYSIIAENLIYLYDQNLTNMEVEILEQYLMEYEDFSKDKNTQEILDYLKSKKKFLVSEYKKPYWVSLDEGENLSLLNTVSTGESYTNRKEEYYDEVLESAKTIFYQISEEKGQTIPTNISEEALEAIQLFLKASSMSTEKETHLKFKCQERVWGPSNPIKDRDCCSGPKGSGPCRMLQCECLELDEDENDIYDSKKGLSWFKGKCDVCDKKILNLSHAIRFPRYGGSWKGCFCSFECMVKEPPFVIETKENTLINIVKNILDEYGIMDRSTFC